jgi:hypothetical protein
MNYILKYHMISWGTKVPDASFKFARDLSCDDRGLRVCPGGPEIHRVSESGCHESRSARE